MNMHARFAGSVASAMSSFTVYSVLSARSSFRATAVNARSAASSADPLLISSSGTPPGPGVGARDASVDGEPCARLILNSLAVLRLPITGVSTHALFMMGKEEKTAPGVEWVVFEDFEHCEDDLRVRAQHA